MKTKRQLFLVPIFMGIIFVLIISGCKKDENPIVPQSPLTETQVADLLAASLAGGASTNGLTAQIEEAATVAGGGSLGKRINDQHAAIPGFDTTIVKSDTIGAYSYHYTFHYSYSFTNLGNRLDFGYSMRGFYETPRFSSADSALASVVVTHILDADTQFTVNSAYNRYGSQISKVGEHLQFTSTISITLTDIKVSKSTRKIQSGTATIAVSGQVSDGRLFSFTAIVTFLGNEQALMVINGKSFSVNLTAGTASAM